MLSANDINAINKETGGWIASEDDKAPWWETNFKAQVNGVAQEFLAEIKGIYTQGLSGYKGRPDWMLWTRKFTVAYQAPGAEDGEFTPIVDSDGNTKVFNANWDKDTGWFYIELMWTVIFKSVLSFHTASKIRRKYGRFTELKRNLINKKGHFH